MQTVERTQTAFRLKNNLLERLKWEAKRKEKSLNTFVEETLEEVVGYEPVYPKLPPEFFEEAKEYADRFVLKGCKLPPEYEGLDGFQQAAMDKIVLAEALYEANNF